jgi:hypothetical protein
VAGATPFPKMGWPDHPIFGQGVASATPYRPYGGGRSHPRPLGVVRPPRKAKKKKRKNGFWPLGVAGPPPRAWGWLRTPPTGRRGWPKATPRPLGVVRPPPKSQTHFFCFFFFFFWPFGVAGPPPKAWGGFGHPHTAGMGWPKPPRFLPFFFFF